MPNVNQNAIDHMSDRAKEALTNGPSPVGESLGPNILRVETTQNGSNSNATVTLNGTNAVDYFVFDMNMLEGGDNGDILRAKIVGFEQDDKIVFVNADDPTQVRGIITFDIDQDGDTDSVAYNYEFGAPVNTLDIAEAQVLNYTLAEENVLFIPNDPFPVA